MKGRATQRVTCYIPSPNPVSDACRVLTPLRLSERVLLLLLVVAVVVPELVSLTPPCWRGVGAPKRIRVESHMPPRALPSPAIGARAGSSFRGLVCPFRSDPARFPSPLGEWRDAKADLNDPGGGSDGDIDSPSIPMDSPCAPAPPGPSPASASRPRPSAEAAASPSPAAGVSFPREGADAGGSGEGTEGSV